MKGLVDQTLGEVETEVSSTEKTSNRTKTKSQLPTNSIREVWTSRDWNVLSVGIRMDGVATEEQECQRELEEKRRKYSRGEKRCKK